MAALTANARRKDDSTNAAQGEETFPGDGSIPAGLEDDRGGRNRPRGRGVDAGIRSDQKGDDAEQGGKNSNGIRFRAPFDDRIPTSHEDGKEKHRERIPQRRLPEDKDQEQQ